MKCKISFPDDTISTSGKEIFDKLNFTEQIYCKYFFLGSIESSSVLLGVGSATVVNNFTSAFGLSFNSLRSFIIYAVCVLFSILTFYSIIKLHHYSATSISNTSGITSKRITSQLRYYERHRETIKSHINRFIIFGVLFLLFGLAFCVHNQFGK